MGFTPSVSYDEISADYEIIAYSQEYAEYAVEEYDMDVDLSLISKWEVSTQTKRRAAAVFHPSINGATSGVPIDWDSVKPHMTKGMSKLGLDKKKECNIQVSRGAVESFDEEEWRDTIRHELIHVEEYQKYGKSGHGNTFKIRAREVDASTSCPKFTEPKYVLECSECGEHMGGRHRKSKVVKDAMKEGGGYLSKCCREPIRLRN